MKKIINYLQKIPTQKRNQASPQNDLPHLKNRIQGALKFLQTTAITLQGKKIALDELPWFLIMGSSGSGKTTLLANSGIKFILNKKFKSEEINAIPPSDQCDWWVTSQAVLVDVPGNYPLLSNFLNLTHKLRGKKGLQGIVMTVSLVELMDKNQREQLAANISSQLTAIQEQFGSLPIYFNISKCDLLPGFLEFFSDYGCDELTQAWGVSLPHLNESDRLIDVFVSRFHQLIKRLNEQLIWRLHQERNPFNKIQVKDFPLQIEKLKEAFVDVLQKIILQNKNLLLRGVYLNSAIQQPEEEESNLPQIVPGNALQQALTIMQAPVLLGQTYFVKQFLLQILSHAEVPVMKKRNYHWLYACAASAFIVAAFALQNTAFLSEKLPENISKPSVVAENDETPSKPFLLAEEQNQKNLSNNVNERG